MRPALRLPTVLSQMPSPRSRAVHILDTKLGPQSVCPGFHRNKRSALGSIAIRRSTVGPGGQEHRRTQCCVPHAHGSCHGHALCHVPIQLANPAKAEHNFRLLYST